MDNDQRQGSYVSYRLEAQLQCEAEISLARFRAVDTIPLPMRGRLRIASQFADCSRAESKKGVGGSRIYLYRS